MKTRNRIASLVVAGLLAISAAAPAMADRQGTNTIIGAGVGGVAGAMLSNGDPLATIGGAAAGGLIGNLATGRDHHDRDRGPRYERRRDYGHDRHYQPARYHRDGGWNHRR